MNDNPFSDITHEAYTEPTKAHRAAVVLADTWYGQHRDYCGGWYRQDSSDRYWWARNNAEDDNEVILLVKMRGKYVTWSFYDPGGFGPQATGLLQLADFESEDAMVDAAKAAAMQAFEEWRAN
jgi:hypothetical protein